MKKNKGNILVTVLLIINLMAAQAQSSKGELNRIWELDRVQPLTGMGGLGAEFRKLDMRNEKLMILEGDEQTDTLLYRIADREIKFIDDDGNELIQDIIWEIEYLKSNELTILLIAKGENEKLARLKYRAKG